MIYKLTIETLSAELASMLLRDIGKVLDAHERINSDDAIKRAAIFALNSLTLETIRGHDEFRKQ